MEMMHGGEALHLWRLQRGRESHKLTLTPVKFSSKHRK